MQNQLLFDMQTKTASTSVKLIFVVILLQFPQITSVILTTKEWGLMSTTDQSFTLDHMNSSPQKITAR